MTGPNAPLIGIVSHPAGSIAALLLSNGLAKIFDLHSGLLGAEAMGVLRSKEREAREAGRALWKSASGIKTLSPGPKKGWEGAVSRVWSGDSISVRKGKDGSGEEHRVQLASVRQPRPSDPKQAGLQAEAKEFLRKKLIGKPVRSGRRRRPRLAARRMSPSLTNERSRFCQVHVTTDYIRPKEGEYDERECVTVKLSNGS
jgi:staphylococcal nuclease domain-containing protein 1